MIGTISDPRRALQIVAMGVAVVLQGACQSTSNGVADGPAGPVEAAVEPQTPEQVLDSLKLEASRSIGGYYEGMRQASDCDELPEICALLAARAESARELVALRSAMESAFGEEGHAAGSAVIRAAFLDDFNDLREARVFTRGGEIAILRIGTSSYRMSQRGGVWKIVQFPPQPYDPAVTAEAIGVLVDRTRTLRLELEEGRIPSMEAMEVRLFGIMGGGLGN
jgi:hypothetical protein